MKPSNPALDALLASRQFMVADLFRITLRDGTIMRYTDFDRDLIIGEDDLTWGDGTGITWSDGTTISGSPLVTYSAGGQTGPYFNKSGEQYKAHWKAGIEVDTMALDVIKGDAMVSGVSFGDAVKNGLFDGAQFVQKRAYMSSVDPVNNIAGSIIIFGGRVTEIDDTRSACTFNIASDLELLNQSLPRNIFQPPCVNTLYDTACTLNSAAFETLGTSAVGSTSSIILAALAQANDYFTFGKIKFTSGANAGFSRSIRAYTQGSPGSIVLLSPFPVAPAFGDAFSIFRGCDKKMKTCHSFGNLVNFRGMPFIPTNETAI